MCRAQNLLVLLVRLLILPDERGDEEEEEEEEEEDEDEGADRLDKLRLLLEVLLLYSRVLATRGTVLFPAGGEETGEGEAGLRLSEDLFAALCVAMLPPRPPSTSVSPAVSPPAAAAAAVLPATLATQCLELLTLLSSDPQNRQHLLTEHTTGPMLRHFCGEGFSDEDGDSDHSNINSNGTCRVYDEKISSGFKALLLQ